jgi:uncharacterized protein YdeI (YjbR/CyaY-like superfamily)
MGKPDPRVTAYITKSADFAKPILKHIREVVHAACPEVEETIKWSSPAFVYHGSLMAGMAAFKQHCRLILWKAELIKGSEGATVEAIGKPTRVSELPSKRQLASYIKQSMQVIDAGITKPRPRSSARPTEVPDYFVAALKKNRKALKNFEALSPSHRREYVEWITEAKREETRNRRIATAMEWLAEGKPRNWKYS